MKRCLIIVLTVSVCSESAAYRLGIDVVTAERVRAIMPVCGKQQGYGKHGCESRIGLLTNHTGRDSAGRSSIDVLGSKGLIIKRLFVPEHGLYGKLPASAGVASMRDRRTGLPVVGLMKGDGSLLPITPAQMKDIDLLMVDLQDVGMRHFTYSGFLFYVMEVAAQYKKPLVVLDRPNPLGGAIEGPCVKRDPKSLISRAPLPLRHGLTMGEMARFYNAVCLHNKVLLHVVPLEGYKRTDVVDDALLANLSPNVAHTQAVYGYSFLGLLGEIRPFDVGIGTECAMTCLGLSLEAMPEEVFWVRLAEELKELGMETTVRTYWSPRRKAWCRGLVLSSMSMPPQASFAALLTIVDAARKKGVSLSFAPFFDRAVGDGIVQRHLQGKASREELSKLVQGHLARYQEQIKPLILYQPAPRVVGLK